jgi:DNA-binding MarR family transcriptional regulator
MNQAKPLRSEIEASQGGEIVLGKLDDYIGFHLRLAQNASFRAFQRKTGQSDLRPGWFALLSLIKDNPGITPMTLSRASGRDKSTLTPILRDMIRDGFVEKQPIARDRRSYALFATASGAARLADLSRHAAEHDRRLDQIVGDRKAELLNLLRRIAVEIE